MSNQARFNFSLFRTLLLTVCVFGYGLIQSLAFCNYKVLPFVLIFWGLIFSYLYKKKELTRFGICKSRNNKDLTVLYFLFAVIPLVNVLIGGFIFNAEIQKSVPFYLLTFSAVLGEELLFRGIFTAYLREKNKGFCFCVLITAAVFALFHAVNAFDYNLPYILLQMFFAFSVGVCFAVIAYRSHSILWCIVFHFALNASSFATESIYARIYYLIISAVCLAAGSVFLIKQESFNETVH